MKNLLYLVITILMLSSCSDITKTKITSASVNMKKKENGYNIIIKNLPNAQPIAYLDDHKIATKSDAFIVYHEGKIKMVEVYQTGSLSGTLYRIHTLSSFEDYTPVTTFIPETPENELIEPICKKSNTSGRWFKYETENNNIREVLNDMTFKGHLPINIKIISVGYNSHEFYYYNN